MPQYTPVLDLSTLDGSDGFRLDGINATDFSGISVSDAGDVNGDGFADVIIGAHRAEPGVPLNVGEAYVVFGSAGGFAASFNLADLDGTDGFRLNGVAQYDNAGRSVSSAGDVNGDGFDDLIVGAFLADPGAVSAAGSTYVIFGAAGGFSAEFDLSSIDGTNGFRLDGVVAIDHSGYSVDGAGDINGDGFDDIVIGAPRANPGGDSNAGSTYVVFGAAGGFSASLSLATLNGADGFRLDGIDAGDLAGLSVAGAGDINGDGLDDLIIGGYLADNATETSIGETYVVFGQAGGWSATFDLSTLDGADGFSIEGLDPGDIHGYSVESAGDINGDGFADIIMGTPGGDPSGAQSGEAVVIFGAAGGFGASVSISTLDGSNGFRIFGVAAGDITGASVAGAGDWNGDGFADMLLAARTDPGGDVDAGGAYILFGAAGGWGASFSLSTLNGDNGVRLDGVNAGDLIGLNAINGLVSSAGDVNGDGIDDIIIGAPGADPNGASSGSSYVIFGQRPGEAVNRTGTDIANRIFGGAFADTLTGLGGDDRLDGGGGVDDLVGGAGDDTYIVDNASDEAIENAGEGTDLVFSSANFTLGAEVENLILTGAALVGAGNGSDNTITGNDESNTLSGFGGDDILIGGVGDDTLIGASGVDTLNGGEGNDTLNGGTGADAMDGDIGDDTYIVDNLGDVLTDASGNDTVEALIDYTLAGDIEDLVLIGTTVTGTGNALANTITGNDGDNTLSGLDGDDTLIGGLGADTLEGGADADRLEGGEGADRLDGGTGADAMDGGAGDDIYIVDDASDSIADASGVDTVEVSFDYTLGADLENLVLIGAATSGTGNTFANVITGNDGDNTLFGLDGDDTLNGGLGNDTLNGGLGADTLDGGAGDDTYIIDADDTIVDASGLDTVQSDFDYTLVAGIENLVLLEGAVSGTGNGLANTITGNDSDNTLSGLGGDDTLNGGLGNDTLDGGTGADAMDGGSGDDTYIVDDAGDTVTDASGNDTVESSIDITLAVTIENLVLTGAAVSGTGNALANTITGNDGDNTLSGLGGADALSGGAGADTLLGGANADTLTGGLGNDTLDGGTGADAMDGGAGDDTYVVDNAGDAITDASGIDTVEASIDTTLGAGLENLVLTGAALSGAGNALDNTITGNALSNRLDGGAGADAMDGGAGDDTYIVDNSGDTITDASGNDVVEASIDTTLGADIEALILTGVAVSGTGNALANTITGNDGDNTLSGLGGDDTLNGGLGADTLLGGAGLDTLNGGDNDDTLSGGADADTLNGGAGADTLLGGVGADALNGGAGDDTYVIDANDTIVDTSGVDTIEASFDYTLVANIENLVLTGSAATGTGNGLANTITGNDSDNTLSGLGGADTLSGGLGNDTLNGGAGADAMDGGAGDDTYIIDADDTIVDASGVDTIQADFDYTLVANIENLILTGSAVSGTGNALANTITGNGGDNILSGLGGADVLSGGAGNDTYIIDADDTIVDAAGVDTIQANFDYTLVAGIENLILTGSAVSGTGNALANTITGNALNNTLDGGAGADAMDGGAGDDTYVVDDAGDTTTDASGNDVVEASVDYTLGDDIETLILTGVAVSGTGNDLANTIIGNDGDNRLDGGSGADAMDGGAGNDTYVIDDAGDAITDASGTDRVEASINYTLGSAIENLVLTGAAASGVGNALGNAISGNSGDNTLSGLDGDDTLNGGLGNDTLIGGIGIDTLNGGAGVDLLDGGEGADILAGGQGDDTYILGAGDTINDTGGTDTAVVTVTFALLDQLENLDLAGANAINGYGNARNNVINGNDANNRINGGFGDDTINGGGGVDLIIGNVGADTIDGGAGDDDIRGGAAADAIDGGEGVDTANYRDSTAAVSVDLALGVGFGGQAAGDTLVNIENLAGSALNDTLTGAAGANAILGRDGDDVLNGAAGADLLNGEAGADTLDGGADADTLLGAAGNDILNGGAGADNLDGGADDDLIDGGAGADTLIGNVGADTFLFTSTLGEIDTIQDYSVPNDVIHLDDAVFVGIGSVGALAAGAFALGAAAADANDRIIYDGATGALFFDADGSGAGAQVQFAQLASGLALSAGEFVVI